VSADPGLRVGLGCDVHPFAAGRPLVLGGVTVPHAAGLAGHSDADVLLHAICDALLGAAALGDIGRHFPDRDPAYRGISSLELLRRTAALLAAAGWRPFQVDACLLAEAPRIAPYADAMRATIAAALGIPPANVGLKATTTEGLGYVGRGEGIAAQAVCLIVREQGSASP
jgi:2-C-methyl-D-erythritol 2,4-cyclodiphosphate synthase